jgi:hypothetical protein
MKFSMTRQEKVTFYIKHTTLRSKSKERFGSNSGNCIRMNRHVYPQTVVVVSVN